MWLETDTGNVWRWSEDIFGSGVFSWSRFTGTP
jgi:hypothetical protein